MSLIDHYSQATKEFKCERHGTNLTGFCFACSRAAHLRQSYMAGVASALGVQYTSDHLDSIATEIAYAMDYHEQTNGSPYGSAITAAKAVVVYLQENGFDV